MGLLTYKSGISSVPKVYTLHLHGTWNYVGRNCERWRSRKELKKIWNFKWKGEQGYSWKLARRGLSWVRQATLIKQWICDGKYFWMKLVCNLRWN